MMPATASTAATAAQLSANAFCVL